MLNSICIACYSDCYVIPHCKYVGLSSICTHQTVFRIGSTSKHFTAMCITLLGEMGELSFDDDIHYYIPQLPDYGTPITIRNMLHHTSGFRNYEVLMELAGRDGSTAAVPYFTDQEAVAMIARQKKLNFAPGERYSYSNTKVKRQSRTFS